jgi:hypothetical protein
MVPASYIKLAKDIGLDSAAVDEARLLEAIHGLDLRVFDFDKVDDYLMHKAAEQKSNTRWVWKPMRSRDNAVLSGVSRTSSATVGFLYREQYAHAIPDRVLADVQKILECEPETVFLVSDYEVIKPDPFLAVTTPKLLEAGKVFIVEQWDEPGYSDTHADPPGGLRVSR